MKIHVFKTNKRGISPLIATVLLISFVVILAVVILFWGKQYVTDLMEKRGDVAAIKTDCVTSISMDVISASGGSITIRNTSPKKLSGFILKFNNGDSGQFNGIIESYEDAVINLLPYSPSIGQADGATTVNVIPIIRPSGIGAPSVPCSSKNKMIRLN